jgi:uncharacterized membrane protein
MSIALLIPLEGGRFGHHGPPFGHGAGVTPASFPLIGASMFVLFLLLVLATPFFLVRRGHIAPPPWIGQHRSPEGEAKRILAERFARGEISSDEFMERASVLNWTPSSDPWSQGKPHKKRR